MASLTNAVDEVKALLNSYAESLTAADYEALLAEVQEECESRTDALYPYEADCGAGGA